MKTSSIMLSLVLLLMAPVVYGHTVVQEMCGDCHWECEGEGDMRETHSWGRKWVNIGSKKIQDCAQASRSFGEWAFYQFNGWFAGSPNFVCNCPDKNEAIKALLERGVAMTDLTFSDGGVVLEKSAEEKQEKLKTFGIGGTFVRSCKNCVITPVPGGKPHFVCECWSNNTQQWQKCYAVVDDATPALSMDDAGKRFTVENCPSNQLRNNNAVFECCPVAQCHDRDNDEYYACVRCD